MNWVALGWGVAGACLAWWLIDSWAKDAKDTVKQVSRNAGLFFNSMDDDVIPEETLKALVTRSIEETKRQLAEDEHIGCPCSACMDAAEARQDREELESQADRWLDEGGKS